MLTCRLHVGGDVDVVGHLGHLHGEALLHLGELGLVLGRGNERHGQALGAEAAGAAHAVQVLVRHVGEICTYIAERKRERERERESALERRT
jgi:hypothetical protein